MLVTVNEGNPCRLVVGLKILTVIMENMVEVPQILKMESRSDAVVRILVTQSKGYCTIALSNICPLLFSLALSTVAKV